MPALGRSPVTLASPRSRSSLQQARTRDLPPLVCASDGNHGLAVAAGARLAGAPARVYLPAIVPQSRANRILNEGAEVVRIDGTYEDAVEAAANAARKGEGILIADTTDLPNDPAVADVMAGYGVIAREVRDVLDEWRHRMLQPISSCRQASAALLQQSQTD
jgi:diaminopropionate ammonia-lyase